MGGSEGGDHLRDSVGLKDTATSEGSDGLGAGGRAGEEGGKGTSESQEALDSRGLGSGLAGESLGLPGYSKGGEVGGELGVVQRVEAEAGGQGLMGAGATRGTMVGVGAEVAVWGGRGREEGGPLTKVEPAGEVAFSGLAAGTSGSLLED